jgi:micrococcal nuclease
LKRIKILLLIVSLCIIGYSQEYKGSILRVIDGDTYVFQTMEGSLTVRMLGIDAPEKDQQYSKESAEFLSKYLNKDATLIRTGIDRYGRTLGTLIIDSLDINMLSLKAGCSWHYKRYSTDKEYANTEEYARNNRIGLWEADNPIPPWEWRNIKKESKIK